MKQLKYGFGVEVELPVDQTECLVADALRDEGFRIIAEIDIRQTMKERLGEDFPEYKIFSVCNPELTHRALSEDIDIGLLVPCNVVVRKENHSTLVSVQDPTIMSELSGAPGLKTIADEAQKRLRWALDKAFDEYIE